MAGESGDGEVGSAGESTRSVRSYRDLEVWQYGIELTVAVYRLAKTLPIDERFGLISQMQRSAVAVPANIAEGNGREMTQDYIRFLRIAQGSLKELETHVIIAKRVYPVNKDLSDAILADSDRIGRMLRSLIRNLQERLR